MIYEFQNKMKGWGIESLDDTNLDEQFVAEAREFLKKVENKELDEEATKTEDAKLVELFEARHDREDVDSDLIKVEKEKNAKLLAEKEEIRKENLIKQAKIEVYKDNNLESLEKLKETYKELPEAIQVIDNKINWVKEQQAESQRKKDDKKAVGNAATLEDDRKDKVDKLEKARKDKIAVDKTTAEAPTKKIIEGLKKLANMKGYYANYSDLRAIGIDPTGDDMEIEGFKLIRQYSFKVYKIISPPDKK